jgi:hypothetical protein
MLRSFILRLFLILSLTAVICLLLMTATLGLQKLTDGMSFCGMLLLIIFGWFLINWYAVRKVDPEISMEVARMVYPSGAILSIALSVFLSIYLDTLIPGTEGKQHFIVPFVGLGVACFLIIRCFDIKWLRGEEEIAEMETGQSE